jgi:hypothetical protein
LCAPDVDTKPSNLIYLRDAPHRIFLKKAMGLQRGRKLQTPTFRDKRELRHECMPAAMMMSGIGFDYGCEFSDEHGKLQTDAASADAFGAVVHIVGLAARDGLARPLLTRNTGAAPGVYT